MAWDDEDDNTTYLVVVNHEEQYSIWPDYRELPSGWRAEGKTGKKAECLEHIDKVWTDMRPLSLRKHMEKVAAERAAAERAAKDTEPE
ncbi:MAG: MbtH family protein [Proteobacteria bacterium]|nr:MbtH family protein [Pseudomonadota bacterium]